MKKQTILSILLISGLAMASQAAISTCCIGASVVQMADEKIKIKNEELPEAVKKTLAGDEYKGWEVSNAYMYKESGTYEVEVKKGTELKTFKFDKEGKLVK
jgi:hypothetical protein